MIEQYCTDMTARAEEGKQESRCRQGRGDVSPYAGVKPQDEKQSLSDGRARE